MDGTQKINLCKNLSSTVIFERTNPRVCCSSTHIYILYSVLIFGIFELNRSRLIRYYLRYFLLLHTFPNHLIHTMIRSYLSEHTNQHSFREIHSHHNSPFRMSFSKINLPFLSWLPVHLHNVFGSISSKPSVSP